MVIMRCRVGAEAAERIDAYVAVAGGGRRPMAATRSLRGRSTERHGDRCASAVTSPRSPRAARPRSGPAGCRSARNGRA
jgi:hypothetical protein